MKQLVLNQTTSNIGFKHNLVGMTGNMNANDSLSNKRLCDINLSLFNSMQNNSLSNNISYELQNMLDDNFDTNSYSSEESSASVESINSDATMPNIDAPILGNIYTTEQKYIIKLMKLLDDMNCPDYAFPAILSWAHDAYVDGFTFNPNAKTRKSNLNWMKQMVVHNDVFYPKPIILNLSKTYLLMLWHLISQLNLCICIKIKI